jgi:MFS family permease
MDTSSMRSTSGSTAHGGGAPRGLGFVMRRSIVSDSALTRTAPSSTAPSSTGPTGERSTGHYVFILVVVLLMAETTTYGANLFYSALAYMSPPFTQAQLPWIVSITLLVAAAIQPLMGKLADVFGRKRILLVVAALFIIGSLIGALATSFPLMMVARALQASAVALPGVVYSFFREYLPRRMVPIAVGMTATNIGIAGIVGPFISGGLLAAFGDYRTIFWFCAIYMAIFAPIVYFVIPDTARATGRRKVDGFGSGLFTFGALLLLVGISNGSSLGWGSIATVLPLAAGVLLLGGFVLAELKVDEPMIDLRLLAAPALRNTMLVSLFAGATTGAWWYIIPQILQTPPDPRIDFGFGLTALQTALVTLSFGLLSAVFGPLGGYLCRRYSPRLVMLICCVLATLTVVLAAFFHTEIWQFVVYGFLMGIAGGSYFAAGPNLVIEAVPEGLTGVSTGIQAFTSAFSASVMPVVLGAVLAATAFPAASAEGHLVYSSGGYTYAFLILGALGLVALVITVLMRHGRRPATGGAVVTH